MKKLKEILNFFKKHEYLTAFLLFLAFTLIYFAPVTINKSTLFTPGDGNIMSNGPYQYVGKVRYWCMDSWGYMLNEFPGTLLVKNYIKDGVKPFWNPYGGLGAPLLSSSQTGLWNVFHLPLYLVNSVKAFDFYLMSKMLFAGFFAYLFFREMKFSRETSAFGAVAFGFSGFFMTWLNLWFLTIDSFLPLVLFFTVKYIKTKDLKWMFFNALIFIMMILMGNVQPVMLIATYMGLFYLIYDQTLQKFFKTKDIKSFKEIFLGFALTFGLAGIVTIPYLLEFSKDLSLAWNIHHPGVSAIHVFDLKALFGFFFTPYKVFNHYQFGPDKAVYVMYLGSVTTFLAGLAVFTKDKLLRRLIIFMAIFCFFILSKISINPFYTSWIDHVPFFNQVAYTKYMATFFFSVAFFAVIGLEELLKGRIKLLQLALPTSFFFVLGLVYFWKRNGFLAEYHFNYAFPVYSTFLFAAMAIALSVFAILLTSKYFMAPKKELLVRVLGWTFVAVVTLESFAYSPIFRLPNAHNPINEPPYISFLQNELKGQEYERIAPIGLTLAPSMQWVYKFQSINMFDAFMPERFFDFSEKLIGCSTNFYMVTHDCPANVNNKFISLLGAKYIIGQTYLPADSNKTLVYDREVKIYKNNSVKPRAFIAYDFTVRTKEKVLDTLKSEVNVDREVVLEETPTFGDSTKEIKVAKVVNYSENEVAVEGETEQKGMLVLTDLYYPDWEVKVDGKVEKIRVVDYVFRGVELDKGKHTVVFTYRPKRFINLSVVSIAVLSVATIFFMRFYKKEENDNKN